MQGDSGGKVSILGGNSVSHCDSKKVNINRCLILNDYRDRAL
jgi:hypothetical protein